MASFLKKAFVGSLILDRVLLPVKGSLRNYLQERSFPPLTFQIGFPEHQTTTNSTWFQYYWMSFVAVRICSYNDREIYEVKDDLFNTLVKGKSMGNNFIVWCVAENGLMRADEINTNDTSLPSDSNGGLQAEYTALYKKTFCPMID